MELERVKTYHKIIGQVRLTSTHVKKKKRGTKTKRSCYLIL